MIWAEGIRTRLVSPGVRRWLIASGVVLILHVLVLWVLLTALKIKIVLDHAAG